MPQQEQQQPNQEQRKQGPQEMPEILADKKTKPEKQMNQYSAQNPDKTYQEEELPESEDEDEQDE